MINEDIPGVEVAVQINGADVREYDAPDAGDEDEACAILTKYIECVDDAFFTVRLDVGGYDWAGVPHILCLHSYVDGQWVRGSIIDQRDTSPRLVRGHLDGSNGAWTLQKLQFTSVKTVDDAKKQRVEEDSKRAKDLGVIEVRVLRGTDHGRATSDGHTAIKDEKLELAEKALKGRAVSHGTSFQSFERVQEPSFVKFMPLLEDGGPIARFRFIYRSRDALKREMVIPRSPTPPPPSFTALSEDDMRRLAKERFEQLRNGELKKENVRPIKREFGEVYDLTDDDAGKKQRSGKMTRLNSGRRVEVIDLSDDDD